MPALEGSPEQAQGCSRFVIVSSLGSPLQGGRESFLFLAQVGGSFAPSHTLPPISRTLKGPPSTGGSRRLNVRVVVPSLQFPDARLPGKPGRRHRELCSVSPSSLAGSRRQRQSRCSRSSSLRSLGSPLQGGRESLFLLSLGRWAASSPPLELALAPFPQPAHSAGCSSGRCEALSRTAAEAALERMRLFPGQRKPA